jgi:hypothetical protein
MDYSKLTKQELINELESIKCDTCDTCEPCATCEPCEICKTCEDCVDVKLKLKDAEYRIKSLEESNAEIRKNEYDFRADSSQKMQAQKTELSQTIEAQKTNIATLTSEKNELKLQLNFMENKFKQVAELFEEYVKAFKDQNLLLSVFHKNTQYIEQHLDLKIKKFNNEGE